MAITTGNFQRVATPQNLTICTLSSYVVPAGTDKILVISMSNSNNGGNPTISSATFDGNAMSVVDFQQRSGGFGALGQYYYLLGDTTPTGDIVVTWNRQANLGWAIHARTLIGAKQQAFEASNKAITTTGESISLNITTLTANAYLADSARSDRSFTNWSPDGTGQTERLDGGDDANNRHASSDVFATTATSYTLGWTQTGRNEDKQEIVSAWEEAGGAPAAAALRKTLLLGVT